MHRFTDNAGRTWTVTIHVTAVKRVRAALGIDLYHLIDDGFRPLADLLADPVQLVDVLYCLCEEEARAHSISDEAFGRALAGDAIAHAVDTFLAELIDFFPDARIRATLQKVLHASQQVRDHLLDQAQLQIERIDPRLAAERWIASSGNSPESSVSTPVPSNSVNS